MEVDFVISEGQEVRELIQVTVSLEASRERELNALVKAAT